MDHVSASVNYLAPGSVRNRCTSRLGTICLLRDTIRASCGSRTGGCAGTSSPWSAPGFALVDHRSVVTGLADATTLDEVYTAETVRLVRQLTCADEVVRSLPAPDEMADVVNEGDAESASARYMFAVSGRSRVGRLCRKILSPLEPVA